MSEKSRQGLLLKRSEPLAYLQVALWPSRHALAPAPSHMSESSRRSLSSSQPLTIPLRRRLTSAQTSCGHRRGPRDYLCNYSFFTPSSSAPTSPASPSSPSNHLPNCPSSTPPSSSTKSAILRSFLLRALCRRDLPLLLVVDNSIWRIYVGPAALLSPGVGGVAGPPEPEEDAEVDVEVEDDVSRECGKEAAEE